MKTDHFSIIGYPKVGNTWIHNVMVTAMKIQWDDIYHTHCMNNDQFNSESYKNMSFDCGSHFDREKLIVVVRHPADVLVSLYMHNKFREETPLFYGTPDDMVENEIFGIEKFVLFHCVLYKMIESSGIHCIIVRYESLLNDLINFIDIMRFVGFEDDTATLDAVELCKFEKMNKNEAHGLYEHIPALKRSPNWMLNKDSFKVRKGVVGDCINHLSSDSLLAIKEASKRLPQIFSY